MVRCTATALNSTNVEGKIVLCAYSNVSFPQALTNVKNAGGSGVIFAQYSNTEVIGATANCEGIACALVDLETANLISSYMADMW
jgi:hypothetical protein